MHTLPKFRAVLGASLALSALLACPRIAVAQITWTLTTGIPGENLQSVYAGAVDNVYASGGFRSLSNFDGTTWSAMVHPSGANRYALYGASATEIYSAGQVGVGTGNLLRFDGSSWTTMFSTAQTELTAVWADGGGKIITVGDGRFFVYDGSLWSQVATGLSTGFLTDRLNTVWGTSASNVYSAGRNGNLLHWDGSVLNVSQPFGTGVTFTDMTGTSAGNILLVGLGGKAYRFDGTTWQPINTGTTVDLHGVHAISSTTALVSGAGGALFLTDGTTFTPIPSGTTRDLFGIHGFQQEGLDYWWVAASAPMGPLGGAILSGIGPSQVPGEVVPEPATMTLVASGLVALAAARRRK